MLLVTEFTTERGEAFTVLQLIKRLRSAIIQIDGILFEHQGRIEELEIDVEEIKGNIEDIKEQLLNIINRVDVLENKVDIVEETLISIESNISNIETILNSHGEDISSLNTSIANMTTELNELQNIVNNIPIVQPSLLNGYIKIDGVDVPVFVGSAGGAGGGGEILASNLRVIQVNNENKEIIEFDIPEFEGDSMSVDIPLTLKIGWEVNWNLRFYFENEEGVKKELTQINGPAGATGEGDIRTFHFFFNIFGGPKSYRIGYLSCLTDQNRDTLHGEYSEVSTRNGNKITKIYMEIRSYGYSVDVYPFNVHAIYNKPAGSGGSGGSGGNDSSTVYTTRLNTLTNDDLNIYKNIWTLPCPPSAIGDISCFEYHATYAMSVKEIDKIHFQCSIMGAEMNLGEININSFEEDFIFMKINLAGGTRKINDTDYFTSSDIEVIISNSNTGATKTSRVLASLNSNRGGTGIADVDDNIKFNMMFTGDEVADRSSSMARGMVKTFYNIRELI